MFVEFLYLHLLLSFVLLVLPFLFQPILVNKFQLLHLQFLLFLMLLARCKCYQCSRFVGLLVKTNLRHFFTTHQPCYVAQLMYVNDVYIFTMFVTLLLPLVNCFEISLNVISSNVHKTVVLYKAVQSFCSDIVAQNVNVISLPTCKVLCFKNIIVFHQSNVRNIPIRSYTINKITFTINTITTIIIIIIIIIIVIIIFNSNITIIIIIIIIVIIAIINKSTIAIIILSFVLHFFDIRSSCFTFIFEFICVFLTTCFFILYWL